MTTFFSSDHHFDHANVIRSCNRPFVSVEEMNEAMIDAWNGVVRQTNDVYYLGDFTLGKSVLHFLPHLNGKIRFLHLPFHHDRRWQPSKCYTSLRVGGKEVAFLPPEHVIRLHGEHLHLSHFPLAEWNRSYHGGWHLHGHCHGSCQGAGKIMDVGVDVHGFMPVSFDEVKAFMESRE